MTNIVDRLLGAIRNVFDPEPLPVAREMEKMSSNLCERAHRYVREHDALTATIKQSRTRAFVPQRAARR